jgi:hypothetical protein
MRKGLVLVVFAATLWLAPGALASGWCGGGETSADRPDVVTGQQVHAVVAVPSDGTDAFATDAGRLADDVTSMLTWWRGQDPTRVPRYDQATFGAANCLDISFLRLPEPSAAYAGAGASVAFARVATDLANAGLANPYKKYLVYFDGPAVQEDVCGTGAGDFADGPSYAVVWLQGCAGVPTDGVATHELLHAFGALPEGAPHACAPADGGTGHPCDSSTDVLYPFTSGAPLSTQVLDFNHDDYYAHSGTWIDIQDSLWLQRVDVPQVALTVSRAGAVAGEIQSDVPGVDCTAACRTLWGQGSQISLTASPSQSTRFVRWAGGCAGDGDCSLTLTQATSVVAVFGPLRIPLRLSVTGKGRIACTPRCGKTATAGNALIFQAVATKGWKFKRWTGACKGKSAFCEPATDFALTTRAVFARVHVAKKKKR